MSATSPERGGGLPASQADLLLTAALLLVYHVATNGYEALRSDHQTQIPLLYMLSEPSLYPRDWFIQHHNAGLLRLPHLLTIQAFSKVFGLAGALVTLFSLFLGATFWFWMQISRRVAGGLAPGIIVCLLAILNSDEIGSNHLAETILIPRQEALAFAFGSLWLILERRHILAGLAVGLSFAFQPAIGSQFALAFAIWILLSGDRNRFANLARYLLPALALIAPWGLQLLHGKLGGKSALGPVEILQLAAYIRHPHHMLPRTWRSGWFEFVLLAFLAFTIQRPWIRANRMAMGFDRIAWIVVALLAGATVFIEAVPVVTLVLYQPFRSVLLVYFVFYTIVGIHLISLWRSGATAAPVRILMLLLSFGDNQSLGLGALAETCLVLCDRRAATQRSGWLPAMALLYGLVAWGRTRLISDSHPEAAAFGAVSLAAYFCAPLLVRRWGLRAEYLLYGAIAAGLLVFAPLNCRQNLLLASIAWLAFLALSKVSSRRRILVFRIAAGAVLAVAAAPIAYAFSSTAGARLESGGAKSQNDAAKFFWSYQFRPVPIKALERLGQWAKENTAPDALFMALPARESEDFRIWSRRSVVFVVKSFPYDSDGLMGWRERYLGMWGAIDPADPDYDAIAAKALADEGAKNIGVAFSTLPAEKMLALCDKYGADYLIIERQINNPRLTLMTSDYDHNRSASHKEKSMCYLYRIERP